MSEFRSTVRAWLEAEVPGHGPPPPQDDWPAVRAYETGWQRKLFDAGYAGRGESVWCPQIQRNLIAERILGMPK